MDRNSTEPVNESTESTDWSTEFDNQLEDLKVKIKKKARRTIPELSDDDLDNFVQEVLARAWANIDKFKGDSKLSTWVIGIAKNCRKERIRKMSGLRKTISLDNSGSIDGEAIDPDFNRDLADPVDYEQQIVDQLQKQWFVECVERQIQALSPDLRNVFVLWYDDKSYEEISHTLGIPIGTVRSRLSRARANLKELVRENCGEM